MENKKYNLFLDDVRNPKACEYMKDRIGKDVAIYFDLEWVIVRNYDQFVTYVKANGLPEVVSFDHDLAEPHYHESMYKGGKVYMKYLETVSEKTGYDCVKWMIDYCMDNWKRFPKWYLHTMNPAGRENMESHILNYLKHYEATTEYPA
jgi:hypothetical protein